MSVPTLTPTNQLNIQGNYASNISSTHILSSYPSTTTSSSLGFYHFLDSNNASTHLNVSASSSGGHIFSHSSATDTPKTVLSINRDETKAENFKATDSIVCTNNQGTNVSINTERLIASNDYSQKNSTVNFYDINTKNQNENTYTAIIAPDSTQDDYRAFLASNGNSYIKMQVKLNNPVLSVSDYTETAILSKNDLTFKNELTFNNVSIVSKLSQIVVPQIVLSSPAIYADSSIAPQPSQFLAIYGYNGWGYIKASPQASNAKINWYLPFPIFNGIVGQLKGLYYQIFNKCANAEALPFFVVYTKPTGTDDYASWYHSSRAYVPDTNSNPNQTCQMFMNIKELDFTPQSVSVQNQINMSISSNPPCGNYADNQEILFISLQTNSGSALNDVNFVCNKIGMITDNYSNYSTEFLLM
jgi:hypothetical protein